MSAVLVVLALATPVLAAKPGANTVTIAANPTQLVFGKSTVISGSVTGPGNAGVSVSLEATTAPYTGAFKAVGTPVTTDANGAYSFTVAPQASTRYHVSAKAGPTVDSPDVTMLVALKVGMAVSDKTPKAGQRVRFSGSVTPAHDGKSAQLQKHLSSGWKTIKTTTLVASTPVNGVARSRYAVKAKVSHTGTYRVVVASGDADHADGTSRALKLKVH
jgi:hypothetical protein